MAGFEIILDLPGIKRNPKPREIKPENREFLDAVLLENELREQGLRVTREGIDQVVAGIISVAGLREYVEKVPDTPNQEEQVI